MPLIETCCQLLMTSGDAHATPIDTVHRGKPSPGHTCSKPKWHSSSRSMQQLDTIRALLGTHVRSMACSQSKTERLCCTDLEGRQAEREHGAAPGQVPSQRRLQQANIFCGSRVLHLHRNAALATADADACNRPERSSEAKRHARYLTMLCTRRLLCPAGC